MVMTEWMKCVKAALNTIPKKTPNRLRAAMAKAKLTYKKGTSSSPSPSRSSKRRKSQKRRKSTRRR
jgi:hypothetical protein